MDRFNWRLLFITNFYCFSYTQLAVASAQLEELKKISASMLIVNENVKGLMDRMTNLENEMTMSEENIASRLESALSSCTRGGGGGGGTQDAPKKCEPEGGATQEDSAPEPSGTKDQQCERADQEKALQGNMTGRDLSAEQLHPSPDRLEDIVPGKEVFASSVYFNLYYDESTMQYEALAYNESKAADGDDNTFFHSVLELTPWWMIDFGEERTVYNISILPRQDGCHERYQDIEIRLGGSLEKDGDFSTHKLLNYYQGPYSLEEGTLRYTCLGAKGRYLSIKIVGDIMAYLQLNTVSIFALKI